MQIIWGCVCERGISHALMANLACIRKAATTNGIPRRLQDTYVILCYLFNMNFSTFFECIKQLMSVVCVLYSKVRLTKHFEGTLNCSFLLRITPGPGEVRKISWWKLQVSNNDMLEITIQITIVEPRLKIELWCLCIITGSVIFCSNMNITIINRIIVYSNIAVYVGNWVWQIFDVCVL